MSHPGAKAHPRQTRMPGKSEPLQLDAYAHLTGEEWLAKRFGELGYDVVFGGLDPTQRKQRIREHIVEHGLECAIADSQLRKPITFAQAFERLYGERL